MDLVYTVLPHPVYNSTLKSQAEIETAAPQPTLPEAASKSPVVAKSSQPQKQQQQQPTPKPACEHSHSKMATPLVKDSNLGPTTKVEMNPRPEYIDKRIKIFDEIKKRKDDELREMPRTPIKITLPNGKEVDGVAYETTPMSVAKGISTSLAKKVIISKVDGVLWDLLRPLESDVACLELLDFENEEGRMVFWHSSAHVLGESCERMFGCHLCIGPPTEDGFYYEMKNPEDRAVSSSDYEPIESIAKDIVKESQKFERLEMTKEELLEMFEGNPYKEHIIREKVPDGTTSTVYRCGPLIDLCYGPHVPNTGYIKAFSVMKNSASYFLGDAANDSLQRIYGISFPDNKQLVEYKKFLEEAAKRDHRKIGKEQELFFFNDVSPGSCFFLPRGARIYNKLVELQRSEYHKRGYQEVITPNIYSSKLWETSGHWQHYKDDMFTFKVEKDQFGLKPMNCPGHCIMFGHRERSYRELPLRMADFGVLHRNEASGALTGLTRVRRFQQDDAHIFTSLETLEQEIKNALDFVRDIYGLFGWSESFTMRLSTRPESFLGKVETWDYAEDCLRRVLDDFGRPWSINPGDGAFYGPKIDITITDALKRKFQCATLQLDFQLPEQFNLSYRTDDPNEQFKRPVMIHRAVLGSVERCMAILIEHFGGKWPFWLSPRQVMVIPIGPAYYDYATEVYNAVHDAGFVVDLDVSGMTLPKKIRTAQLSQYNFVFVVGQAEQDSRSVNIRNRDEASQQARGETKSLEAAVAALKALDASRSLENQLVFSDAS
ncbi:tars protein [Polychytrium aggregatum]|uniref:tars protein n=1 Tax=Polychytrium aggregatum TaxID=110093 RepID=UPI0022FDCA3D|nr:tars protein [Polychytrium aggregatum]KAI9205849.1 tars protein [Polychytrium aggregatum]